MFFVLIHTYLTTFKVGYTNAGKSTLLNQLTGADVLAEDKLFATLDPTTRRVQVSQSKYTWRISHFIIHKLLLSLDCLLLSTIVHLFRICSEIPLLLEAIFNSFVN